MTGQPMTMDDVRGFALSLPGAGEQPHFDSASFRVGTKIFATLPATGGVLHVFVDDELARAAAQESPGAVELLWWGKRLSGLRVHLPGPPVELVWELIIEAWRRKAPRRLVAEFDALHPSAPTTSSQPPSPS